MDIVQQGRRIRNLYIGATGWRWEDHEGETDLSGLRESLKVEFDEWFSEVTNEGQKILAEETIAALAERNAALSQENERLKAAIHRAIDLTDTGDGAYRYFRSAIEMYYILKEAIDGY